MKQTKRLLLPLLFLAGIAFAAEGNDARQFVDVQALVAGGPSISNTLVGWVPIGQDLEFATSTYRAIEYLPSGVIWVGGGSSPAGSEYGWRSTDHGVTWTKSILPRGNRAPTGVTYGFAQMAVKDADNALAAMYDGRILRTTNGGASWDSVYGFGTALEYVNGIAYVGGDTVLAYGDNPGDGVPVFRSLDAGATWTRLTNLPLPIDTLYYFGYVSYGQPMSVVGRSAWIPVYFGSGTNPAMLKTTDGGDTWTAWVYTLPGGASNDYYLRAIAMVNENLGFGVNRRIGTSSNDDGWFVKTTDGGVTWDTTTVEPGVVHQYQKLYAAKVLPGTNDSTVLAVGFSTATGSKSWISYDQGATWTVIATPGTTNLTNFAFISSTQGFVAGFRNVMKWTTSNPVTFQVNMKVKILEGAFNKATDWVEVRGGMNGWASGVDTLKALAAPNDSVYAKTILMANTGAVDYKFWASPSALGWESDPNRQYVVPVGGGTTPLVYFNRDSLVSVPTQVTFQVNMRVKLLEGTFNRATDAVTIRGSFNDWGNSTNNPDTLRDADVDSIYTITKTMLTYDQVFYKFWATGLDYESLADNRSYSVLNQPTQSVPVVYFNNDTIVNVPINANILWQTNMGPMITLGWFDPAKDLMEVRGDFTGWGSRVVNLDPDIINPALFSKVDPYSGTIGDIKSYKFFINHDSLTAVGKWGADYPADEGGFDYEHPCERGDGNYAYVVTDQVNQEVPISYYNGVNPQGLLGAGDSVNVTVSVNMGPATRYLSQPFVPATDTVFLCFQDALWRSQQRVNQGVAFPQAHRMSLAAGGGDSIYTVTIKVKGPTHYYMMYFYRYAGPAGTTNEGGGLGGQNPYRGRFIQRAGTWPASYATPQDLWQKDAPMPGESAQFTTDRQLEGPYVPLVYKLDQNYPNPFNPATMIKYSIPTASKVVLKVFNILGQEVATLVNDVKPAGSYVALFEANRLASGVYFYRLEAGSFTDVKKMLLLK